jgi:uncharacterized RDD family membrane protein YckC
MTMPARCSRCGIQLSDDAPQGLCPQCLIKVGMESNSNDAAPTESFVGGPDSPSRSPKSKADLPVPGEQFGNYRLIRKLGEGGMGAVFEAEDLNGERQVALKLLAHSLESREARNRFFREGRLAASINHPNSVYVYGTEEIDGTPAISMEHISGGTLQDRVRSHGPLPVNEAVDVILQIIAGLEAAATVGVLHRDIKPSNCFVDAYGTVKIGDFGLSISTEVRGDSYLTEPGSFLGTPAFSSPEQLRGDELDIRSDIYAVGVTLYYLLTGKTPFEADNLVQLLATVLEQPATSPATIRSEIPNGLARIVLRCLAKQSADRFASYADLRDALVPYDSSAPTPATLALRALAGFGDLFLWNIVIFTFQVAWFRDFAQMTDPALMRSPGFITGICIVMMLHVFYFAIPEGLWGASLGKAICRLRVVDRNRGNIGVPRAFIRTIIYVAFPSLIVWGYWLFGGAGAWDFEKNMSDPSSYWKMMVVSYSYYVMLALLFSTARRRNGYSGLHDLATGSRVILRAAYVGRPTIGFAESPLPEPEERQTIGPYHVLDSLQSTESEEFLLAYDTRLLRRVWIHRLTDGSPSISSELRNLGRVGRLRWINGRRTSGECWDAYEALSGKPLLKLLSEPRQWTNVRYWLMDLAYETSVAERDGTMPQTLSLDRVWVTAEGRAKLLDFPAPGTNSMADSTDAASAAARTFESPEQFLFHVAASALQGRITGHQETCLNEAAVRLPVKARLLIDRLGIGQATPAEAVREIRTMTSGAPAVTRLRRVAMLIMIGFFPLFVACFSAIVWLMMNQGNEQQPEMVRLRNCLTYMDVAFYRQSFLPGRDDETIAPEEKRQAFETYISGTFREIIDDKASWNSLVARTIPVTQRARAQQIIAENPEPTEQALAEAAAVVEPVLNDFEKSTAKVNQHLTPLAVGLLQFVMFWILFVAVPGMIAAIAFRRGLVLRMFGVDHVVRNGCPASRMRMLWRSIVFNSPVLLSPLPLALVLPLIQSLTASLLLIVGLVLAISCLSLMLPQRGIPDRLSGTYPVPS